jgi:hypothetical protein
MEENHPENTIPQKRFFPLLILGLDTHILELLHPSIFVRV